MYAVSYWVTKIHLWIVCHSLLVHLFFKLSWEFTITFMLWSNLWICWTWIKILALTFPKNWFLRGRGWICICSYEYVCVWGRCMAVCSRLNISWHHLTFISPFVHHSAHVVWNTELRSSFLCPSFKSLVSAASAFCRQEVLCRCEY